MKYNTKPAFRKLTFHTNASCSVKVETGEKLKNSWHYHPEIELILLRGTEGTRIIGNSIEAFKHNDIFLIGRNTPHCFLHNEKHLLDTDQPGEAIVIQFYEYFMGKEFLELPEFKVIHHLFAIAKQGLCITEKGKEKIIPLMEEIPEASSLDRILLLLQILRTMILQDSYDVLDSEISAYHKKIENDKRINKVYEFTSEHYDQNIKIEQVAEIINLTKESFCRYFKAKTGKSYLEFLIEFRIDKARKMLLENQMPIKEIAYCCGFDSLSNFHYQFKKIVKQSPNEYKISQSFLPDMIAV